MANDTWRNQLAKKITTIDASSFETLALDVFKYQAANNPLYAKYISLIGKNVNEISSLKQVPFLPISFFKNKTIKTGDWSAAQVFTSSGTTANTTSKHYLRDAEWYKSITKRGFEHFYGDIADYCFLALLPAYLERKGSSLIFMADYFIKTSKYSASGFFLDNVAELIQKIDACHQKNIPTILLGVSFALWDLAEQFPMNLHDTIVMETGGMKGRREEITRPELHRILSHGFQAKKIHSEYGMTELLSQAYSKGDGIFYPSPTMKILNREITDPFSSPKKGKIGVLNIIDLGNIDTISFIATDDLGIVHDDGAFEILGRLDASDVRGCNLMVVD